MNALPTIASADTAAGMACQRVMDLLSKTGLSAGAFKGMPEAVKRLRWVLGHMLAEVAAEPFRPGFRFRINGRLKTWPERCILL